MGPPYPARKARYLTRPKDAMFFMTESDTNEVAYWDKDTKTCYGILASVRLDFATRLVGEFTAPQSKLVGVSQTYEQATWRWADPNPDGTHDFYQCHTVEFVETSILNTGALEYVDSGVVYPLFHQDWGVPNRMKNTVTVLVCGVVLVGLVLSLLTSPMPVVRRLFSSKNA